MASTSSEVDVLPGDFESLRKRNQINQLFPEPLESNLDHSNLVNGDVQFFDSDTSETNSDQRNTSSELQKQKESLSKLDQKLFKKSQKIFRALVTSDIDYLSYSAISKRGLVHDSVRQKVWPKLVGVDICSTSPRPVQIQIEGHPYYQQVLLDVNRSLKRFPPSIKEKQRLAMQDQLVLLIMRVLLKNPKLHYYQGYHDICVTFLLVLGEEMAFYVVDKLSVTHLKLFMQKSMEPTMEMLTYLLPIIQRENSVVYNFLRKSDVGVMFALSWMITWFGHVLNNYNDVVRLFDFFIATDHWMPVYLSAAIVLHRKDEILREECDMACVHSLLLQLPENLPFEKLILNSMKLYDAYPPIILKKNVQAMLNKEAANLKAKRELYRRRGYFFSSVQKLKRIMPSSKLTVIFVVAAIVAVSAIVYQSYETETIK